MFRFSKQSQLNPCLHLNVFHYFVQNIFQTVEVNTIKLLEITDFIQTSSEFSLNTRIKVLKKHTLSQAFRK